MAAPKKKSPSRATTKSTAKRKPAAKKPVKKAPAKKPPAKKSTPRKTTNKSASPRSTKRPTKRTSKPTPISIKHVLKFWLPVGVVILIFCAFLAGWPQRQLAAFTASQGLVIERWTIAGLKHADVSAVEAALGVNIGDPLASFDPEQAHSDILDVQWVEQARVRRIWPNRIDVILTERAPIAIVEHQGIDTLVDVSGTPLGPIDNDTKQFRSLPRLVGDNVGPQAPTILALIATQPTLEKNIKKVVWVNDRRWNLLFRGGLEVKLPAKNPQAAYDRLATLARTKEIFDGSLRRIDLRIQDRMVVKPSATQ